VGITKSKTMAIRDLRNSENHVIGDRTMVDCLGVGLASCVNNGGSATDNIQIGLLGLDGRAYRVIAWYDWRTTSGNDRYSITRSEQRDRSDCGDCILFSNTRCANDGCSINALWTRVCNIAPNTGQSQTVLRPLDDKEKPEGFEGIDLDAPCVSTRPINDVDSHGFGNCGNATISGWVDCDTSYFGGWLEFSDSNGNKNICNRIPIHSINDIGMDLIIL